MSSKEDQAVASAALTKWQTDVTAALNKLGASLKCDACNKGSFVVMPSPVVRTVSKTNDSMSGSASPPLVNLGCDNCGKVRQHSPSALGVTP